MIFSLTLPVGSAVTGTAAVDLQPSAAAGPKVVQLALVNVSASSAFFYGVGRTTVAPQITPLNLLSEESGAVSTSTCASQWTSSVIIPTVMMRRFTGTTTIANGVIWTFPRGLQVAPSTSFVVWNLFSNPGLVHMEFVIDE